MRRGVLLLVAAGLMAAAATTGVLVGFGPASSTASSHREAPLIADDPAADNADLYAFVSPDKASTVTLVANYIPPTPMPNRLGVLAGDLHGFPNGRRLADDVTDIELRAVACGYGTILTSEASKNENAFLPRFPYVAAPNQGYAHTVTGRRGRAR